MRFTPIVGTTCQTLLLAAATLAISMPLQSSAQTTATPKAYPIRDFFSNPEKGYFRLSDDGRTLGFMQPVSVKGAALRMNVFVQPLKGSTQ